MSEIPLRECPFCGAKACHPSITTYGCWIECSNCASAIANVESENEAIEAWNARHDSGWVKCSERLPEEYIDVLALCEEGIIIGQYANDNGGWSTKMNKSCDKVTHWRELPAPPEDNPSCT